MKLHNPFKRNNNAVEISRAIERAQEWPPLPASWPPVEPLATCLDPDCGCTDLDPLVARISATLGRLETPARRWTVQRERMVLFTGSGFHWTIRDPEGVLVYAHAEDPDAWATTIRYAAALAAR